MKKKTIVGLPVIVLGGGVSGLVAAERLVENGVRVIIFEQTEQLGGLAKSVYYKQKWLPVTYHHVTTVDDISYKWLKKYDLTKRIHWKNVYMSFWYDFKPYMLTLPHHIAFFSPLSIIARLRLARLGMNMRFNKRELDIENVSAEEWLNRSYGKSIVECLFKPLAEIEFGELSSVSASWLVSRLHEAAKTREKYAYFPCKALIDKIAQNITSKGGIIHLNAKICGITQNRIKVILSGKKKVFKAKKIISSIPPPELVKVLKAKNIKKQIQDVKYAPMICAIISCKDSFLKSYWNIFIRPKLSFGGIFSHSFICPDLIKGEHIYYVFTYLKPKGPLYNCSENVIKKVYLEDIKKINPSVRVKFLNISKIRYASPIFSLGYKNLPIKLSKHIYLTGIYREYPSTRTINSAIKSGLKTASCVLNEK